MEAIARGLELLPTGGVGELRARLWYRGAEREAGGRGLVGSPLQPVPIVLGGKLVHPARGNGAGPPARSWPRPVPPAREPSAPAREPDTVEELLGHADALLGARLGAAGRNKGAFGARVAELLGVAETGAPEPDWRGEVEIKTVPVVVDPAGWWRVQEDPAVSMASGTPRAKRRRVLWFARVDDRAASPALRCDVRDDHGFRPHPPHARPPPGSSVPDVRRPVSTPPITCDSC